MSACSKWKLYENWGLLSRSKHYTHEIKDNCPPQAKTFLKWYSFVSEFVCIFFIMRILPHTSKFWSANFVPLPLNPKNFATHPLIQKVRKNFPTSARVGGWSYVTELYNQYNMLILHTLLTEYCIVYTLYKPRVG